MKKRKCSRIQVAHFGTLLKFTSQFIIKWASEFLFGNISKAVEIILLYIYIYIYSMYDAFNRKRELFYMS